jgi:tetratricopeptide (TPR) repeat protein
MRRCFAVAVAVLLASVVGHAQVEKHSEAAMLQGFVRDSANKAVAGATVSVVANKVKILSVTADSTGKYQFANVPPGAFTLCAEKEAADGATCTAFALKANESRTIDITLKPAKASQQPASSERPEFFEEPHFTVAGVTDTTSMGGHGSDATVRNRDTLAKATAALSSAGPSGLPQPSAAEEESLRSDVARHPDDSARHHLLAEAEEELGQPLDAVKEYEIAAKLNPSEANLFDWGAELLIHHAPQPAIEVFTKGNRLFPASLRMLVALGAAWYSDGSYDRAAQRLGEASDLNPADANPYLFMGKLQAVESTEPSAMVERLARFAKLQPENALANYYYAVALWKRRASAEDTKDIGLIETLLIKAEQLDPKLGVACLQLGILHAEQKDFATAIPEYQRAIAASPELEQAHYRLAQAYRLNGDAAKAHAEMQEFEKASRKKTEEVEQQRHELQQFVYRMRDETTASPP